MSHLIGPAVSHRFAPRWLVPVLLVLAAALGTADRARAATDGQVEAATAGAVAWIAGQQLDSGSLGPSQGLDASWALIGLAAAGRHAADLRRGPGLPSAADHYRALWTGPSDSAWASSGVAATDYERITLVATAVGLDPLRLSARQNLLAKLAPFHVQGWFTSTTALLNHTIFGLLALTRYPVPVAMVEQTARLVEQNVHDDGGYAGYHADTPATRAARSDVDMTGAAIAALCAAGRTAADPSVAGAIAYLKGVYDDVDQLGSYDSVGWALQGLTQCGIRRGGSGWTAGLERAVDLVLAGQLPSGGWPTSSGGTTANFYSTQNVLRALVPAGFLVEPPDRQDPLQPRLLTSPAVTAGTVVPTVVAIDEGRGGPIRLCAGDARAGAGLAEVLASLRDDVVSARCVRRVTVRDGRIHGISSVVGTDAGGWRVSVDRGPESDALAATPVAWGTVVSLRLVDPSPDPEPADATPDPDPGSDPGSDPDPEPPSGPGPDPGPDPTPPAEGPTFEPPVTKPAKPAARKAKATCTVTSSRVRARGKRRTTTRTTAACCVTLATGRRAPAKTRLRLTRGSRTYADGTVRALKAIRSIPRGRYVLRIGSGRSATNVNVSIRPVAKRSVARSVRSGHDTTNTHPKEQR